MTYLVTPEIALQDIYKTTAEDVMMHGVTTVKRETPVYQAIATLVEKNITGLPVVDNNMFLQGIISEKDVLKLLYKTCRTSGVVEGFMTESVVSFNQEDSLTDICDCLANNHFRRVPILSQDKVVSVLSRADFIRISKNKFRPPGLPEHPRKHDVIARDIMKRGLVTARRQTPIYIVMELLSENNITGLPVVDSNMQLEGIVTEKDILSLLNDSDSKPCNTEDIMTKNVISFEQDDGLFDICDCLLNNSFRRVPILDQGQLVGIVSRADIIDSILRYNASLLRRRHTDQPSY